ncbi:adenylate kinase 9 [Ciona intestinalis]
MFNHIGGALEFYRCIATTKATLFLFLTICSRASSNNACNSAVEKKQLILNQISMSSKVPETCGDPYDEDVTELNFLKSKPTCFLIIGKPRSGRTTLARKLSQYWRCEFIHATDIITREVELATAIGEKMNQVLLNGECLTNEFVFELIREKVISPEVAHYGYILDGLPIIDDNFLSIQEQIDQIQSWKLKPDIIINIKVPDEDLFIRREGTKVDSLTGDRYGRNMWDTTSQPPKMPKDDPEEEEDEEEKEEDEDQGIIPEFNEMDKDTKARLVNTPENQATTIEETNSLFKNVALIPLEEYMADHDQQYLIELDGKSSVQSLFQQLVTKLDCYNIHRPAVPSRLQNPDEEELPDEIETEELLRTLAAYQNPAPRYRWRRSKWGRTCPVALKEGNILQGKPDLAVSFLDKMYILSSPEAMTKFLKNPRPYLLPPMPAAPCKISVLGAPLSGKTAVAHDIANHYKASVFDMNELMKDKFKAARKTIVEKARSEALESALLLVQNKLEQEAVERAEFRRKENERLAQSAQPEVDAEDKQADESSEPSESAATSLLPTEESYDNRDATSPVPVVTQDHEEVKLLVQQAVEKAEKHVINLPAEEYVSVLKDAVEQMIKTRLDEDPDAAKNGGWVLDNFPENKEQWAAMVEAELLPDEVVFLVDKTPNNEVIRQRYYDAHKDEITQQFRTRLVGEKRQSLQEEEEEQRRLQEESERPKISKIVERNPEDDETSKQDTDSTDNDVTSTTSNYDPTKLAKIHKEILELEGMYIGVPSYDAPEFQTFRDMIQDHDKEWGLLQSAITGSNFVKPLMVEIKDKTPQAVLGLVMGKIEALFRYQAWDFSGVDLDEEEEDASAELEQMGDDMEEGEDEEAISHKKKHFGYAKHYDPVALKDEFVLWPGNPDIAAKYREKIYYFKSTESREIFVGNTINYLPKDEPLQPPPPRILILGARGCGKTSHGRWMAEQLGVFHISFREKLQEMILAKTGRKLGPDHEESRLLRNEMSVSVEDAVVKALSDQEEKSEEEEAFDLNDIEDAIKNYLVDDEDLSPQILETIIPKWWREEPFKSTGFILEGFPRSAEDCQFLAQSGLYPDAALMLMVEENDVVDRLLPPRLELWKKRRDLKNIKKNKIKEKKMEIKNEKMEARRAQLLAEREERKASRTADGSDDEDEEEEDDIEETLAMEFEDEEEGEEDEEEHEDDAADRMRSEFAENFDDDINKLQVVQEQLEEVAIPRLEVQASRKPTIVRYFIDQKIESMVAHRRSMFERVYPLSIEVSDKMVHSGFKHPSSFGRWDPVKLMESKEVLPPLQSMKTPTYPLVYNQYIFYLSSIETRQKFMENPLKYVLNQPPAKPVVPIQIAIIGPPKSGKTTLAQRLSQKYGALRVSIGDSIRNVIENQSESILAKKILSFLNVGSIVPDVLAVEALTLMLLNTTCTTRGYVLDGYPNTEEQVHLLHNRGIIPVKVVELKVDDVEILKRANQDRNEKDKSIRLHDSDKITLVKRVSYADNIEAVREWYSVQHQNLVILDGKTSKWKLWKEVVNESFLSVLQIQNYIEKISDGKAANLFELCISPNEFSKRLGCYKEYCPVSLNLREELVDCSNDSLQFAVEYRSKYYKTATKEDMETFLANPEKFVPPLAMKLLPPLNLLPKKLKHDQVRRMFPKRTELNGYCPVSYLDGKLRYEALVEGNNELVVEYRDKLYAFATENRLEKFMRTPEKYCDLKLPDKLPPKKQPMDIINLPMLGYLEQMAATSIIKALTSVGCFKPKFPFLTVKKSALFYVACHLKAYNSKSSSYVRKKYLKKLEQFEANCELITYLGTNMSRRYTEPDNRPDDFNEKMEKFLKFQNNPFTVVG